MKIWPLNSGAVVIGLVGYLMLAKPTATVQTNDRVNQSTSTAATDVSPAASSSTTAPAGEPTGQYVTYSEAVVASTAGTKILFFHAPWCPQCRALDASIRAGTIPAGVTIFKVDYDSNQALRKQYGVTIQTTLITVNDQGELVDRFVAYDDPSLKAVRAALLK